jgi:hypothetical protein
MIIYRNLYKIMVMDAMRMNQGHTGQYLIVYEESNVDATMFFIFWKILTNHYGMVAQITVNYQQLHRYSPSENLWATYSVSSVRCSQLVPITQFPEFTTLLNQGLQERTTHLNEKYERLFAHYEELRRMVMNMRSLVGHTCAPLY